MEAGSPLTGELGEALDGGMLRDGDIGFEEVLSPAQRVGLQLWLHIDGVGRGHATIRQESAAVRLEPAVALGLRLRHQRHATEEHHRYVLHTEHAARWLTE